MMAIVPATAVAAAAAVSTVAPASTTAPVSAIAPLPFDGGGDAMRVGPYAQILEDTRGDLTFAQLRSTTTGWRAAPLDTFNFGVSKSVWWVRASVRNITAAPLRMVVDLGTPNMDYVDAYVVAADGQVRQQVHTGDRLPFSTRGIHDRTLAFAHTLNGNETVDVYLRVATHDGLFELMPLRVFGTKGFVEHTHDENLLISLFHGGLIVLVLYNLFLFVSTREKNFGLYVVYLVVFLINSFAFRGFDMEHLWPDSPRLHNIVVGVSASLIFASGGAFTMAYLHMRRNTRPWVWQVAAALIVANVCGALLGLFDFYTLAAGFAAIFGLALVLFLYVTAAVLAMRDVREARFVVMAFTALICSAVVYYLQLLDVLPATRVSFWAMLAGSWIELMVLGFGLADAMNTLKTQKLQAERAARENQEAMALRLEKRVVERTLELAEANRQLSALSITDELTGAYNRRHFDQQCAQRLAHRGRGEPIALCIFDIDLFKQYNDRYGHVAGDAVLRRLSHAVLSVLHPEGHPLFRLGGEEFATLFTTPTEAEADALAHRLRETVNALALPHADSPRGIVTASFGVAWWGGEALDDLTPEVLYAAADRLLYEAKRGGRDRVVVHTQAPVPRASKTLKA